MRKFKVTIEGVCKLKMHKMTTDKDEMEELKQLSKILQRDPTDEKAYKREAELYLYTNGGKLALPLKWIKASMIKAGAAIRQAGKGKKTYKDSVKAFIIPEEELVILSKQNYEVQRDWVRIGSARILRSWPVIDESWKATFHLTVLDDTIPDRILRDILDYAGYYVGIGEGRPEYGRFKVIEFEEIKKK